MESAGGPKGPRRGRSPWMGVLALAVFAAAVALVFGPRIRRAVRDSGVAELLAESRNPSAASRRTAAVCFVSREGGQVAFRSEEVLLPPAPTVPHAAVEALLEGPSQEGGLQTLIPRRTRLLGLAVRQGRAFVDLSRRFLADPSWTQLAARQVALTLRSVVPGLAATTILVEGKVLGVF